MKSKVLFILHLAPPIHGASVMGSYIQKSEYIKNSFESEFINLSIASDLEDIGKSSFKKIRFVFQLYLKISICLLNNKFELCYLTINASGLAWLKELIIVAILKLFQVPIVYHFHNKGVRLNSNSFWKKRLYKFQFFQTKSILLSSLLEDDISQFVNKKDIYVCPNGIPNRSQPLLKNNTNKICQILFLSNLIESKGVYVLLDACKLLMDRNIPFRCLYIGEEGDVSSNQLKGKIGLLGLEGMVEYQGKKYGLEKEKAFGEANIFAFPTFYPNECFPIVNLEAMQVAIPVISTFEGAIPEVILDSYNGFLVPQKNAIALAEKLEVLIANPELRNEMGLAGKRLFEIKFTLEVFEKRIVEVLQQIIKGYLP